MTENYPWLLEFPSSVPIKNRRLKLHKSLKESELRKIAPNSSGEKRVVTTNFEKLLDKTVSLKKTVRIVKLRRTETVDK